jgi:hypothetical protein
VEAVRRESRITEDGSTQAAYSHNGNVPEGVKTKDQLQPFQEVNDAVTASLLAEPAKVAQILADLSWGHLKFFAQLLRTDDLSTLLEQTGEDSNILGEASYHHFWRVGPALVLRSGIKGHIVPAPPRGATAGSTRVSGQAILKDLFVRYGQAELGISEI